MKNAIWLVLASFLLPTLAEAQWAGFVDRSSDLETDRFPFFGTNPLAGTTNENYYDGDLGDFDGDGTPDRVLGSRYGLLFNTGDGYMEVARRDVGFLLRGDPGASGWGEDAAAWVDVDGDGDLDGLMGGNGEPLTCQINDAGRFRIGWIITSHQSALNIVNTDLENDGDVDLLVAHSFCPNTSCGGPTNFAIFVNDGTGRFHEESSARGLGFGSSDYLVGVVSGDVDGDRDYDVVIAHGTSAGLREIIVGLNDGTGHFTRRSFPSIPIPGSGFMQGMSLGDIDDDGDLDLVIGRPNVDPGGHPVIGGVIAMNDGRGNFTDESAARFDAGSFTGGVLAGPATKLVDLDYDGDLDIVAYERNNGTTTKQLLFFLNDGTGHFTFDATHSFMALGGRFSGLGIDVDIGDLDGDGSYDIWVGTAGDVVRIFENTYADASGVPADQPRSLRLVRADASGVVLRFAAPPFAAVNRHYRVYRSMAAGLADRDRTLLHTIGERFEDQDFQAPITRHTTTAYLGDPAVTLDGAHDEITFTDATAVPGIRYFYAVSQVGTEQDPSAHTPELSAMVPGPGGADRTAPSIEIARPTTQDWTRWPHVVAHFGDGGSGVDPSTVEVRFDRPLGSGAMARAAGTDVSDLAIRRDGSAVFLDVPRGLPLPMGMPVTLTVSVSDMAGNAATRTVRWVPSVDSPMPPTAAFTSRAAPSLARTIELDASGSADPDGQVMRWDWYFSDGTAASGRLLRKTFAGGGTYDVTLVVRDNQGGVGTASRSIDIAGPPPTDGGVPDACTPDCAGRTCGSDGCGGTCGSCATGTVCASDGTCLCEGATVDCGGACVDTRIDASNCGACGETCASGEVCVASACMPAGTMCMADCAGRVCGDDACGGSCGSCGPGGVCAGGGLCACGDGTTDCDGVCVDTSTDPENCGGCAEVCGAGESCAAGHCSVAGDASGAPGPGAAPEGSCTCTAVGAARGGSALAWASLALVVLAAWRRRRGAAAARHGRTGR